MLNREQIAFAMQAVSRWIQVMGENKSTLISPADVSHSSLLERLLEGQEPTRYPPPLAFGYPWVELVQKGTALAHGNETTSFGPPALNLNQTLWLIEEKHTDGSYTVYLIVKGGYTYRAQVTRTNENEWMPWRVTLRPDNLK